MMKRENLVIVINQYSKMYKLKNHLMIHHFSCIGIKWQLHYYYYWGFWILFLTLRLVHKIPSWTPTVRTRADISEPSLVPPEKAQRNDEQATP